MGVIAKNYGNAAYQFTTEQPDLIDQLGFFDTWIDFLGVLLVDGKKSGMQSTEFFSAATQAGRTLIANKADLTKKTDSQGYVHMFSWMTIRACEVLGAASGK